jgi:hypothetical protein
MTSDEPGDHLSALGDEGADNRKAETAAGVGGHDTLAHQSQVHAPRLLTGRRAPTVGRAGPAASVG